MVRDASPNLRRRIKTASPPIAYCSLNFPENGSPAWLNVKRQRVNPWPIVFELQDRRHRLVPLRSCDDWLFLGDRFLRVQNRKTQNALAEAMARVKFVVISDLAHAMEGQYDWLAVGLPRWMPRREYELVTNSPTRLPLPPGVRIHHYDFLFNRTKSYYLGFPFCGSLWYYAGHENYRAPAIVDNAIDKQKIFLSPCRLYLDQNRTTFRKRLFDLTAEYADKGYRSGPGRVQNGVLDKKAVGGYLRSTTDDPLINSGRLGWKFNPENGRTYLDLERLASWKGSEWHGYNPVHNHYYDNTFISIYGETIEYGNFVVVTEKTYEPLIKGHFILPFSNRGFLAELRAQGFLLPEFINYSYDEIADDEIRYDRYALEVRRLIELPTGVWRRMWRQHIEILRHNQRLFHLRDYNKLHLIGLDQKGS